jgi:chaperonin GroEL
VATGFSESVLGTLSAGWAIPNAIKVFPLVIPKFPIHNGQVQFLEDLSAITGAAIFDPLNKPLDSGTLEDLGPGVDWFEASRFRSTIVGKAASRGAIYEAGLMDQIDVVETMLLTPESEVDKILLQERLGKLTGGIAKLKVIGASNGELKEKRDRAEDAVCSVRGALKYGCLPGGGWTLLKVISCLDKSDPVVAEILAPALMEPVARLLTNFGLLELDIQKVLDPVLLGIKEGKQIVYDIEKGLHGDARELGVLDSVGAVLEAVRNSISAAGLLGTLGGTVVFARDHELERTEARDTAEFLRTVNDNPADNRA